MASPGFQRGKLTPILIGLIVVVLFGASHFARLTWIKSNGATSTPSQFSGQRVVALSPSLVEIIYELELGDQLVGVSRFCLHPPEAAEKTVVGGYLDLDFEKVVRLQPDIVLLLREQEALATRLHQLGINSLTFDHASTRGILGSISKIGESFRREEKADVILKDIADRLSKINSSDSSSAKQPRVLISIDRDASGDRPDHLIAAGRNGVHQEYLKMVGAVNAYDGPAAYPSLSREKLIQLNPDVIIELISPDRWKETGEQELRRQWHAFPELKAVRNDHLIFLHEHRHMIPGPRFVDTVEAIAEALQNTSTP